MISAEWVRGLRSAIVGAAVILAAASPGVHAASSITDLGPLTNNTPEYLPLGSFRHAGPFFKDHGKIELLFLGTQVENLSAAQRWAVVKALDQFGTLTGVAKMHTHYCEPSIVSVQLLVPIDCGDDVNRFGNTSTFDFRKAHFSSRYVEFRPYEIIDRNLHLSLTLPKQLMPLYERYVKLLGYTSWHDEVWQTATHTFDPYRPPGHQFPLTDVGGYLETGANVVTGGDIIPNPSHGINGLPFGTYPSFSDLQSALQTGKPRITVPAGFIPDVNAETNIIIALICHADGKKPASVCDRSLIQDIMKHVKGHA